jgi:hypothetical protein
MMTEALAELIDAGRKHEEALRSRDLARVIEYGEHRERACRRLALEMDEAFASGAVPGSISEADLAGGLRRARAANLRSIRLARAIARDLQHEIETLDATLAATAGAAGSPARHSRPRYIDRRG